MGIIAGHAYSVLEQFDLKDTKTGKDVNVLRLRNPWAGGVEWKGDWSDNDTYNWTIENEERVVEFETEIKLSEKLKMARGTSRTISSMTSRMTFS
jgi:opacity protein-like surface antigen